MAALRRLGDEVWLIGPTTQQLGTPNTVGFSGVVSIRGNGSNNNLGIFVRPWQVQRFLKRHRFDVVHLHEPQCPLLPFWVTWLSGTAARVATFHAFAENNSALWSRRAMGATLFGRIHRAIAVSQPAARYAQGSWRRDLAIIPNGVCAKVFRPADAETPALPEEGPLRLMFVGALTDTRKGARHMLEAFRRLRARGIGVVLEMVGDTEGYGPLPEQPGLTFAGEVSTDDLARRYRDTDVFVAPATGQESFGIVLLEAMASGKPVICSDIEGYRSAITPEGAVLVAPNDPAALTEAIADFAARAPAERQAMGQANLAHVQQFDWDNVVHQVRGEYLAALRAA
jgi:phosphatidylinositol alpha-mannosyltransferase